MNYLGELFTVIFRALRPFRLCARYSEFRLRLCRARSFVVVYSNWIALRFSSKEWLKALKKFA